MEIRRLPKVPHSLEIVKEAGICASEGKTPAVSECEGRNARSVGLNWTSQGSAVVQKSSDQ